MNHHLLPDSAPSPAVLLAVAMLGAYLLAVVRQTGRDPRAWSRWRTVSFGLGVLLLTASLTGPLAESDGFPAHVLTHLLLGMLAPLALVLGAPITLLIRTLDTRNGRTLVRLLRSSPTHLLTHPLIVLISNIGGLYLLYLTPLYHASSTHPTVHDLVHLHFLANGYLFSWVIAGPDPGPRRASVRTRITVLGIAVVAHATLSQLMYAGVLKHLAEPMDQVRAGAALMYYGADLAEILLALALLATWRPSRTDRPAHAAVWPRLRIPGRGSPAAAGERRVEPS